MQFSNHYQEVAFQSGLDYTDATIIVLLKRWVNVIQQDISSRWPWNFLVSREVVQTTPDKTAGTVNVTSGTTSVTGTSTSFASTDVGKFISFQGANDWYKVTTQVGQTLTVEAPYAPAANLSSGTYILRQFFYSLSSTADSIIDIRNWNTPMKMVQVDAWTMDTIRPNPPTSASNAYIAYQLDSSGNVQISPIPFPNDTRNFEVRTIKRLSDLVADTDTSIIPVKWHHIINYGATALAYRFKRQMSEAKEWLRDYENKITDMIMKQRLSEDELPVMAAIDSYQRSQYLKMGSNWPVMK
jgi:hypothetical protein